MNFTFVLVYFDHPSPSPAPDPISQVEWERTQADAEYMIGMHYN